MSKVQWRRSDVFALIFHLQGIAFFICLFGCSHFLEWANWQTTRLPKFLMEYCFFFTNIVKNMNATPLSPHFIIISNSSFLILICQKQDKSAWIASHAFARHYFIIILWHYFALLDVSWVSKVSPVVAILNLINKPFLKIFNINDSNSPALSIYIFSLILKRLSGKFCISWRLGTWIQQFSESSSIVAKLKLLLTHF